MIEMLRQASLKVRKAVGILGDLQGPKIRTGRLVEGAIELKEGAEFSITTDETTPGTQEIQIVVPDAEAARAQVLAAGVEAGEVDVQPWGNFVHFRDPDGNILCVDQVIR